MPNPVAMSFDSINESIQVNDNLYYSNLGTNIGGFNGTELSNTYLIGPVMNMIDHSLEQPPSPGWTIIVDHLSGAPLPINGDFISFAKDKTINTSSLVGYYASVNFVNNSKVKAELFSVGSEISESSK